MEKALLLGWPLFFLFSCSDPRLNELERENRALRMKAMLNDSLLTDVGTTFGQIDSSIRSIEERENKLFHRISEPEKFHEYRSQILQGLEFVEWIMAENRKRLKAMEDRIQTSSIGPIPLQNVITHLKTRLVHRTA